MSLVLALAAALLLPTARACPLVDFVFQGQPDCVELRYAAGQTRLTSSCEAPVLVDQSVLAAGVIMPGASVEIRDLAAFTLGLEGKLYRAVAELTEPVACAEEPGDTADAAAVED